MTVEQAANYFLLQGTERTVSPVAAEWGQQVRFWGHEGSISDAGTEAGWVGVSARMLLPKWEAAGGLKCVAAETVC